MPKSSDNDSTIIENMDNADIVELTSLNDYVDKIRFEHRQNLIPTQEHKVEVNTKPFLSNHDSLKKVEVIPKPLWVSTLPVIKGIFFNIIFFYPAIFNFQPLQCQINYQQPSRYFKTDVRAISTDADL